MSNILFHLHRFLSSLSGKELQLKISLMKPKTESTLMLSAKSSTLPIYIN